MKAKLRLFLAGILASAGIITGVVAPMAAMAVGTTSDTSTGAINCGAGGDLTGTNCQSTSGADEKVNKTIKLAIQLFQIIVGLISVFMLISAGLKYITGGGESSAVSAAKNMILYAVIGLVVVALAQVIVSFVLNRVSTTTQL
ncbi:hypothetical protein KC930_01095 [Candidatus Saccharibacteria bacterium]|nr:hypothetical protein [Candidatus Saccharibacteria bacterium]